MKTLKSSLTILFGILSIQIYAQQLEWARSIGSSSTTKIASVREDVDRNAYITAAISGNVDVDPGPGTIIAQGGGLLIEKLDQQGNYVWHHNFSQSFVQIEP